MAENQTIGTRLDLNARGLAAYAADSLLARDDYKDVGAGFRDWQAFFESRVRDLAAAADANQPRIFVSQIRWCRAALAARGESAEHMTAALTALRDVVAAETGDVGPHLASHYIDSAIADCDHAVESPDTLIDVSDPHGRLAAQFVLAVLEGRRLDATSLMRSAVADGLAIPDAYLRVLVPAVREIGRMWHMGEVTIAEEHFASDTAQTAIAQLQGMAQIAPGRGRTMLAASVAGNRHDLGTRILANLFEIAGWRAVCLGGDMPGADIAQSVIDFQVDMLLLSATLPTQLRAVERTISLVRNATADRPVRIVVGGQAFDLAPELAEQYGADGHAQSADEALRQADDWFSP